MGTITTDKVEVELRLRLSRKARSGRGLSSIGFASHFDTSGSGYALWYSGLDQTNLKSLYKESPDIDALVILNAGYVDLSIKPKTLIDEPTADIERDVVNIVHDLICVWIME